MHTQPTIPHKQISDILGTIDKEDLSLIEMGRTEQSFTDLYNDQLLDEMNLDNTQSLLNPVQKKISNRSSNSKWFCTRVTAVENMIKSLEVCLRQNQQNNKLKDCERIQMEINNLEKRKTYLLNNQPGRPSAKIKKYRSGPPINSQNPFHGKACESNSFTNFLHTVPNPPHLPNQETFVPNSPTLSLEKVPQPELILAPFQPIPDFTTKFPIMEPNPFK